jgi:hypothetical protein
VVKGSGVTWSEKVATRRAVRQEQGPGHRTAYGSKAGRNQVKEGKKKKAKQSKSRPWIYTIHPSLPTQSVVGCLPRNDGRGHNHK